MEIDTMKQPMTTESKKIPKRNYTPLIWVLSAVAVIIILGTNYIPRSTTGTIFGMDLTILPLINAILNGLAFILLICALVMVKKGNIQAHRNFILSAFGATFLFLISYLTFHAMSGSTSFGSDGIWKYIYYFILITHLRLRFITVIISCYYTLLMLHFLQKEKKNIDMIINYSLCIQKNMS